MAKLNTIRVLLSLATNLDWLLYQFDVKNVFLHGELEDEVYMDIPPSYIASSSIRVVYKLQMALYGLKQSSQSWFGHFNLVMRKHGFQQDILDHFFFFFYHQQGKITTLIIYLDNMIIIGDDTKEISKL